jgi:hypothetical protein
VPGTAAENILLAQHHSPEGDLDHIRDLIPALRDDRYIRVNGKPLLLVYRTEIIPDPVRIREYGERRRFEQESGICTLLAWKVFPRTSPPRAMVSMRLLNLPLTGGTKGRRYFAAGISMS